MPITFKIPTFGDRTYGLRINLTDSGYNSADSNSSIRHSSDQNNSNNINRPTFIERQLQQQPRIVHYQHVIPSSSSLPSFSSSESSIRQAISENPARIKYIKDGVISILDQIDTRVNFLRETAAELEEEKRKLSGVLTSLKGTEDLSLISEVDKEEIFVTADRLLQRLQSVQVMVTTLRNDEQRQSLDQVNNYIDQLVALYGQHPQRSIEVCQVYLNTCCPDSFNRAIDDKFQRALISCTAEDQKKIRKRLEALKGTLEHSAQICG